MKPEPLTPRDEDLLHTTRHAASRHLDVPPTPRDTLAVLRQAAEATANDAPMASWFPWLRGAIAALAVITLALGFDLLRSPPATTPVAIVQSAPAAIDPGIDLAEWNVELESLFDDVATSLDQLTDNSDLNALAQALLN
ncbi:MAG TPA: hypothetical protein PKC67_12310 [Kiritimatiellia bacterium]|nr:hypothetical protein [Kiritimatiellia bacterium]HMP35122.1 hypothetical protein [Kiritimatiellia bacterium]